MSPLPKTELRALWNARKMMEEKIARLEGDLKETRADLAELELLYEARCDLVTGYNCDRFGTLDEQAAQVARAIQFRAGGVPAVEENEPKAEAQGGVCVEAFAITEIREAIQKKIVSQAELVRASGLTKGTVSLIARGMVGKPSYDTVSALYTALQRLRDEKGVSK